MTSESKISSNEVVPPQLLEFKKDFYNLALGITASSSGLSSGHASETSRDFNDKNPCNRESELSRNFSDGYPSRFLFFIIFLFIPAIINHQLYDVIEDLI